MLAFSSDCSPFIVTDSTCPALITFEFKGATTISMWEGNEPLKKITAVRVNSEKMDFFWARAALVRLAQAPSILY